MNQFHYSPYQQRVRGQTGHYYPGRVEESPPRYVTAYTNQDSGSTPGSANRFTVHGYQFIEDFEKISPRLIQTANLMHYNNSAMRTSLIGEERLQSI